MSAEISYVIINPYTLSKSRTGNILNRLLARTALDLCGARMFAPSGEMVRDYAALIQPRGDAHDQKMRSLIRKYVEEQFAPEPRTGLRRRLLIFLLKGEDAIRKTHEAVGSMRVDHTEGETIRDTYADYILDPHSGEVRYFEPAVLVPTRLEGARERLAVLASYSSQDGGLLEGVTAHPAGSPVERTLVMVKPDNFKFPSGRPGSLMDVFSRAGLKIVGAKVHHMSVAQAESFYEPVLPAMVNALGEEAGKLRFEALIQFMTGLSPVGLSEQERQAAGSAKLLALVYEGTGAVKKMREVLGPTDPNKAAPGTIRREFGESMMINAAHASDSPENARREMALLKFEEDSFKHEIETFLAA